MKALLDQNLSFRLVELFRSRFPGSCHVRDVGLTGDDDERIWALAKTEGFVIVTKDNDFLARALVRGHPPQVIQICLGNASTQVPVVIPPESFETWLDPAEHDVGKLSRLLRPFHADEMTACPVSTLVNNARVDKAECVEPLRET